MAIDEAELEKLAFELMGEKGKSRVIHFLLHDRTTLAQTFLEGAIEALFAGKKINASEKKAYRHRIGLDRSHLRLVTPPKT